MGQTPAQEHKCAAQSISRFARNTEDCLHFVRKLKDKGIAVYFETENIDTIGSGGELLLTILSGMAQDSSRNQSDQLITA
ncbi:recombinase family protein [Desulfosporosinus nitroreducens]|uniref:recombinase family protein n=1 Tax=Desulfosporosinus nitroreducens TaxID=2018668 RepID=UPI00403B1A9E